MTQTLKQGDRGALVSLLQLGLQRAGQTPGALDGILTSIGASTMSVIESTTMPALRPLRAWTTTWSVSVSGCEETRPRAPET